MKKKTIKEIVEMVDPENLVNGVFFFNALLLVRKLSSKNSQSGIINKKESLFKYVREIETGNRGLNLLADMLKTIQNEKLHYMTERMNTLDEDDYKKTVFSLYHLLMEDKDAVSSKLSAETTINDEFYSFLLKTVDYNGVKSIYDPAFGLGMGFVLIIEKTGHQNLSFTGQELNKTLWANMKNVFALLDYDHNNLYCGNTLASPDNVKEDDISKYDLVIVDPPQGIKVDRNIFTEDEYMRFKYGYTNRSELAFVEHGLASTNTNGEMIALINHNTLKKSGKEKIIRKNILKENCLDTVIQFSRRREQSRRFTPCILIIKPGRQDKDILMVDYSHQKTDIDPNLTRIVQNREELERISVLVAKDEIKDADYSLTPSVYISKERFKERSSLFREIEKKDKRTLKDIATINSGVSIGKKALSKKETATTAQKIYFIKSSDIEKNGAVTVDTNEAYWYSKQDKRIQRTVLQKHDIVFVTRGDTGKVGMVHEIPDDGVLGAGMNMAKIRVDPAKYSPFILFQLLKGPYGTYLIKSTILESGILKKITLRELSEFKFPMISPEERKKFDEQYKKIAEQEAQLRAEQKRLKKNKEALTQTLFS